VPPRAAGGWAVSEQRVGLGFDVHALAAGAPLILGGVTVPSETGLVGHSDADVLTHAVMDALLGAAALGDLGELFPSSEERWRGASSLLMLREVMERVSAAGWQVANVDATIVAEAPRLAPFRAAIRRSMSEAMGVSVEQVGLKATTTDHLGAIGRREGMAAFAVALVERRK